jgi:hypothetical protein
MKKKWIYLDDIRTPLENEEIEWIVVRDFYEFVHKVSELGITKIDGFSFDHDLGPKAMDEYYRNVRIHYKLIYDNIDELTGYHACKWLIDFFYESSKERSSMAYSEKKKNPIKFPQVTVHSHNPIGAANIMGYINNFFKNEALPESCIRYFWPLDPKSDL